MVRLTDTDGVGPQVECRRQKTAAWLPLVVSQYLCRPLIVPFCIVGFPYVRDERVI
ncbi:hypothetical protein KPB2_5581 [Klebsiella pneumoniae Kb677]|nr:hypothetical protein KPB2_5581 [Klebsiella pneumoniae Kb677]